MANYGKYKQQSSNKPSMAEIMAVFGQVQEIMKEHDIGANYEGVKKTMDLAGLSMEQLKGFRSQANLYINNPIAKTLAKSQNVDINKFLDLVDDFIAQEDGMKNVRANGANSGFGNRQMRRGMEKVDRGYDKVKSWRDR